MKKQPPLKQDKRKIPQLFRAVEKDSDPEVFYGSLISDDGMNFVCYAMHTGEGSIFKERVLDKHKYTFGKIDADDFGLHVRRVIFRMEKEASDKKLEFEAAVHTSEFAHKKLIEILEAQ